MIKKISLILLVLFNVAFAQEGPRGIFIETHQFRVSDSTNTCYVSCKIPYDRLIFLKNGGGYHSAFNFAVEVTKNDTVVVRDNLDVDVVVDTYEETNAAQLFYEGLLSFDIPFGKYNLVPVVTNLNTQKSHRIQPITIDVSSDALLKPFIIDSRKYECAGDSLVALINFQESVPFSVDNYAMIIAAPKKTIEGISVEFRQKDSLKVTCEGKFVAEGKAGINKCGNRIVFTADNGHKPVDFFLFNDFSSKLSEGAAEVLVLTGKDSLKFPINVYWVDKPVSLYHHEFAIEILENIDSYKNVRKLLNEDEERYYEKLTEYWEKYDRNKATAFNEIMAEFYNRVDYSVEKFGTINNNGAKTDRGKIYVKFGPPDRTSRKYTGKDKIIEVWHYDKIKKEFYFADESGLGNFLLIK